MAVTRLDQAMIQNVLIQVKNSFFTHGYQRGSVDNDVGFVNAKHAWQRTSVITYNFVLAFVLFMGLDLHKSSQSHYFYHVNQFSAFFVLFFSYVIYPSSKCTSFESIFWFSMGKLVCIHLFCNVVIFQFMCSSSVKTHNRSCPVVVVQFVFHADAWKPCNNKP